MPYTLWDQLAMSESKWKCTEDVNQFLVYKDNKRLNEFLIAFHDDFESIWASLLHHSTLPTFDVAIKELLFKETCK